MDVLLLAIGFICGSTTYHLYRMNKGFRCRLKVAASAIKWQWLVRVGMKSFRVSGGYRCPLVLACDAILPTPKAWYKHSVECFTKHYVKTFVEQRCLMCNRFIEPRRHIIGDCSHLPWHVQACYFKRLFYPEVWACRDCATNWRYYQIEVLGFDDTDEYHFAFENLVHDWLKKWKKVDALAELVPERARARTEVKL